MRRIRGCAAVVSGYRKPRRTSNVGELRSHRSARRQQLPQDIDHGAQLCELHQDAGRVRKKTNATARYQSRCIDLAAGKSLSEHRLMYDAIFGAPRKEGIRPASEKELLYRCLISIQG